MQYKIEMRYLYGWDDAGWTEETDGKTKAMRFEYVGLAQAAIDEFFADVKVAVLAGDMDTEAVRGDYRIVAANDRD